MQGKFEEMGKVLSQKQIAEDIFDLVVETKDIASFAKAGQFVNLYSKEKSQLLPRPISICEIEGNTLRFVYRRMGKGTTEFSALQPGDSIKLMGPLGNGFPESEKKVWLIGGGIGIPPMLQLAKTLGSENTCAILGYRKELFLLSAFEKVTKVYYATEDGSAGSKGTVINAIEDNALEGDVIMACGPKPMLRALKEYALAHNMECYVSMEERMACGVGACLGCVCKSEHVDDHSKVKNKRVCKDGPVFDAREVDLS